MKNLTDWFDRVFVLNCAHRKDRLEKVRGGLVDGGLVDWDKVIVFPAVIGAYTTCPADWKSGRGAWGCRASHSRICEDVLHHRDSKCDLIWKNYLVLEDDVEFLPGALENLNLFMAQVPADWDQIYLGGQHCRPPEKTPNDRVIIGRSVNRTHAYALSSKNYTRFYRHINHAVSYRGNRWHIDHQLEIAHQMRMWKTYCPDRWLCGQAAGKSDISEREVKAEVWQ